MGRLTVPPPALSIVIPTWNGGAVLARHLPEVCAQAGALPGGAEVLAVDDATELAGDDTPRVVADCGARLLRRPLHAGFGPTANAGVDAASAPLVLLLNSDMRPAAGALEALVAGFEDRPRLFALVPAIRNLRADFPESSVRLRFHRGVFDVVQPGRAGQPAAGPAGRAVAYACGGAMLVRRDAFLALGGFAGQYAPFYWEDADLGLRAWRAGLAIEETGASSFAHDHAQTIGSHFDAAAVRAIYERNRLLFTWTHLQGAAAWARHVAWMPLRAAAAAMRRDAARGALASALARWPAVRAERRRLRASRRAAADLNRAIRRSGPAGWPT